MLLSYITKFFVSCDVTFDETKFYHSSNLSQTRENHWDTTVSMPITLPISSSIPNEDPIQTNAADCSQPVTSNPSNLELLSSSSPKPIHPSAKLGETDTKEDLSPEKPVKVYSRRPKQPDPQITQLLEPKTGPTSEDNNTTTSDLNLRIAIRKGVRSCAKYPMSNYLTYSTLSSQFKAFNTTLDGVIIPSSIHEALSNPNWKRAVMNEMKALESNQTWELVDYQKPRRL